MPTVTIDANKCDGCQACIGACPQSVFEFDEVSGKAVVAHPEKCDGCRVCEGICPQSAITVTD